MKSQTEAAIARARDALAKARRIDQLKMHDVAARQAYTASLTAARALIYEQFGNDPKTHKGIKTLMHELVRKGLPIDRELLTALEYGFELKIVADYGESERISAAEAKKALDVAEAFVNAVDKLLRTG